MIEQVDVGDVEVVLENEVKATSCLGFFLYDFVLLLSVIVVRVRSRTGTTNRSVGRSTTKKKKGAYGSQRDDFVASTTTTTRTSA